MFALCMYSGITLMICLMKCFPAILDWSWGECMIQHRGQSHWCKKVHDKKAHSTLNTANLYCWHLVATWSHFPNVYRFLLSKMIPNPADKSYTMWSAWVKANIILTITLKSVKGWNNFTYLIIPDTSTHNTQFYLYICFFEWTFYESLEI